MMEAMHRWRFCAARQQFALALQDYSLTVLNGLTVHAGSTRVVAPASKPWRPEQALSGLELFGEVRSLNTKPHWFCVQKMQQSLFRCRMCHFQVAAVGNA